MKGLAVSKDDPQLVSSNMVVTRESIYDFEPCATDRHGNTASLRSFHARRVGDRVLEDGLFDPINRDGRGFEGVTESVAIRALVRV